MESFKVWLNGFLAGSGKNILTALVVLFIGLFVIKIVSRVSKNSLQKTSLERTTISFVISIIHFALYAVLIYLVASILIPNVSAGLIAVLGSAALAIGLALKDSLSDFASGIMIIFNKPFKEGDYISVDDCEGTIRSIHLLHTVIYTGDNKKIVLNNSKVNGNRIINYSARPTRRVDLEFSAAYGSDINKVKQVLTDIAYNHPLVLKTPEPFVRLYQHAASSLVFRCRVWVNNSDYWTVYYDITESVYEKFNVEGIEIPFNNVTVHLEKKEADNEK